MIKEIIQKILKLWAKQDAEQAESRAIARHLAKVLLWELKGVDRLYPDLRDKYKQLEKTMKELGMPIKLSEGFRSAKKQDRYYKRVPKITNARGLESYHQLGLAMDCISKDYGWNPPKKFWDTLGREGKKKGLIWGGDWKFKDVAHFEWHSMFTWKKIKPYFELDK